jgi:hypothetical protein
VFQGHISIQPSGEKKQEGVINSTPSTSVPALSFLRSLGFEFVLDSVFDVVATNSCQWGCVLVILSSSVERKEPVCRYKEIGKMKDSFKI